METIERLNRIFEHPSGSRFKILYGPGVDDTFISPQLVELNLSEALYEELRKRGYERIIFYSPLRSIYFYDEQSLALTKPQATNGGTIDSVSGLQPGPLEEQRMRQPSTQSTDRPRSGMGDVHAFRLLNAALRQSDGPLTAIIFPQAGTMMQFFDDPRTMASMIGEWAGLPSINLNKVFFLFAVDSFESLANQVEILPIPELRSAIQRQAGANRSSSQLAYIRGPQYNELRRLVRLLARQRQVSVQSSQLDDLLRRMVVEGRQAREWISLLIDSKALNQDVARQKKWFQASRSTSLSAMQQLDRLVGLEYIKQRVYEIGAWAKLSIDRKHEPENLPTLHMIFTGNPGTGKTTVARLFGEFFWEMGFLQRGHLIEVKAGDLVADHIGGTAIKTNAIIDQALDGVLFIDEAYALVQNERGGFSQEAVETLLKRMEDERSRLVVIAAGYPDRMVKFRMSNPGLARRFPEENVLDFPDMNVDELVQILSNFLIERTIPILDETYHALNIIVKEIHRQRDSNFGNAGEMRNLAEAVDRRRAARLLKENLPNSEPMTIEDIPVRYRRFIPDSPLPPDGIYAQLDHLIGLENVKAQIRQIAASLEYEGLRSKLNLSGATPPRLQHMVFLGNPGTGKTTVARLVGKLFCALGLLAQGHVVEVSRSDLIAGYVGQTALKTLEKVQAAQDGVLFIDEAYTLIQGQADSFGNEALNSLVKAIEDNNRRMLVIVAGYPSEMTFFLNQNPGLASRLPLQITFEDLTNAELVAMFKDLACQHGYSCSPDFTARLSAHFEQRRMLEGRTFGNGRTVVNLFEQTRRKLAVRVLPNLKQVKNNDFENINQDVFTTFMPEDLDANSENSLVSPGEGPFILPGIFQASSRS